MSIPIIPKGFDASTQVGFRPPGYLHTYSYFLHEEASSAMQKCIRRGDLSSLQWCMEMYWSNVPARTNLWNRLMIISVEDVGPAEPLAILWISKLRSLGTEYAAISAAYILTMCKKTRVADWSLHIDMSLRDTTDDIDGVVKLLSDSYKSNEFVTCIACLNVLVRSKAHNHIFAAIFPHTKYIREVRSVLSRSKDINLHHLTVMSCFHLLWSNNVDITITDMSTLPDLNTDLERLRNRENLVPVPEYAIDKHTRRGRSKGFKHFVQVGSLLCNRDPLWIELDNAYISCLNM